ncbi:hypothetical protein ThrDRAFT_03710 [Frankia casuarinae]|uniref:Cytochrome c oxidase polypeptide 4 n=1 Tax=Frankia casuarinae (strain DSM 45818 / CECT 9043 / HFP020203 / CcI3) TaxID=106370 RepID=Q2JA33_FRACC|nr:MULTISPECIES: cytochrome c oxidase subunit 4 [Frankia]ABD11859.1 conserved hypothetical protein [Frankia casuarinae]ETA00739.1 hypothetical protein CcI6DRAFT_03854 [Frankia sp. CcI6]EYT90653.1 hypothetical protein ThrDRAFT_03710 [Frankia casuarinae]KDA41749.1 hypothetical protein BMG523Draft_03436 [Frankia sp. BMG5.23]KEZ35160.1 Cytochrome c oxidase subunit IV [Frankia sp. CeD]
MITSARLFAVLALFFLVTGGVYLFTGHDPAGAAALIFSMVMSLLVAGFLWYTGRRSRLPADDSQIEIPEGAGDIGFFSPFSYWPAAIAVSFGLLLLGPIISYWLLFIGGVLTAITIVGLVFQHESTDEKNSQDAARGHGTSAPGEGR